VDEIYAMNRMPVIYAAPIDAVPETPDFDGFRQQDSDLYDTCLESRDTCSTICSTVIDFEQAVCSTPQKTRVEVFV
jgi:hypothetical protein